ncbi:3-phosphoshikimate 1-carboxyvinyltransferase [Streptomyces sp. NPDC127068]|uniref:3-phosphoshikimate 1-carboxyvinyltransferase n=1 Tax=Streptomyces sp. NPDC127068 TaxID=3347127 RepID=UPI0036571197
MHLLVKGIQHRLTGEVLVPSSKYHAHRALILASLAEGVSRVHGRSDARHVQYTARFLRSLGVKIATEGDTFVVHGLGGHYRPHHMAVSAGSSGTTLAFMIGLASLSDQPVTVTGQKYFHRRPIGPLLTALRQMGVGIESPDDRPPVRVAARRPSGGRIRIAGTLSQWISGLLLCAPFATGPTTIEVEGESNERSYLELTVAMMRRFGLTISVSERWRRFDIEPGQRAVATELTLPPDIGSAGFGIAAAALHPCDVLFKGVNGLQGSSFDHPESRFLDIARAMGVPMEPDPAAGGVRIQQEASMLTGVTVNCRDIPDMLPILSTLGAFAQGESVLQHIAHTRLKESDRAAAMLQLNAMGGDLELDGDTLRVRGVETLRGTALSSFNDHRVLMSLAVASTRAGGRSTLTYPNAYQFSYPGFLNAMNTIGVPMSVERGPTKPGRQRTRRLEEEVMKPDLAARVTLPEWLRRRAASRPHEAAVVELRPDRDETVTWRKLHEWVERTASLLLGLGVRPGENVAYQLPNRIEFVVLSLAALRIGAVCCPVMPFFRERELGFVLRRSKARVLVVSDRHRGREPAEEVLGLNAEDRGELTELIVFTEGRGSTAPPEAGDTGVRVHAWEKTLRRTEVDRAALDAYVPSPDSIAQLLFTSGTTGEPKGVPHSSRNLVRAVSMEAERLGLHAGDVIWVPSPLAHQTGFLYGMTLALVLGVPQITQVEWDAQRALPSLNTHGATFAQAAPPFLTDLMKAVEAGGEAPRGLRIFVVTGAQVPDGLAERAGRILGTDVYGAFGTTETGLGTLSAPGDTPTRRWSSAGRPLDGVELRITDDRGLVLPPGGSEGNVELRSPTVFDGYLDRPDLTAEAFTRDGWYRTGDLATLDDSGFLRITGRLKDVINRGGEKIPVAEIEQLLSAHPAIEDIAIVAMPDARLGERACAFVVFREGARIDLRELCAYLNGHRVAKRYWPERLETLDALPRNPVGKVQKLALRARARDLEPPD